MQSRFHLYILSVNRKRKTEEKKKFVGVPILYVWSSDEITVYIDVLDWGSNNSNTALKTAKIENALNQPNLSHFFGPWTVEMYLCRYSEYHVRYTL